jgi:anti-sigma regulatory factor (Ser/Thr protein kinase)
MATVEVSFSPLPAHVRTARLVALAVARRAGVSDDLLDEVRLAVGEACSRAVGVHVERASDLPVTMQLSDDLDRFTVQVTDMGSLDAEAEELSLDTGSLESLAKPAESASDALPAGFGLAVISGLVEDVDVTGDSRGTHVRMVWPSAGPEPPTGP